MGISAHTFTQLQAYTNTKEKYIRMISTEKFVEFLRVVAHQFGIVRVWFSIFFFVFAFILYSFHLALFATFSSYLSFFTSFAMDLGKTTSECFQFHCCNITVRPRQPTNHASIPGTNAVRCCAVLYPITCYVHTFA